MSKTNYITVEPASVSFYGVGYLLAAGAAYAKFQSIWWAFVYGFYSWAYIGYLWAIR